VIHRNVEENVSYIYMPFTLTLLETALSHHFVVEGLGVLRYFLDIEVDFSSKIYFLSQSKYIVDLYEHVRLFDNKIVNTPLETSVRCKTWKN